jgi:hypothetical protein
MFLINLLSSKNNLHGNEIQSFYANVENTFQICRTPLVQGTHGWRSCWDTLRFENSGGVWALHATSYCQRVDPRIAASEKGKLVDLKRLFFLFLFMLSVNLTVTCKTK